MLLTATTTAASMASLMTPSDLAVIKSQVPGQPFTVFIQNTQASATLYVAFNFVTATSTAGVPLATNDSVTVTCTDLYSISLISSAATNTVIFTVIQ